MVKKILLIVVALAALITLGISYDLWEDSPPETVLEGDLNNNGVIEQYVLKNFKLTVIEDKKILWESPKEFKVDQLSIGDLTGDGKENLIICVWKEGSFGRHRPFWHEGKDDEYKHHLFVYEYREDRFKPRWFSSSLTRPIIHMELIQKDDIGHKPLKLLVVEGLYKKAPFGKFTVDKKASALREETKLWEWDDWGFLLLISPGELDEKHAK